MLTKDLSKKSGNQFTLSTFWHQSLSDKTLNTSAKHGREAWPHMYHTETPHWCLRMQDNASLPTRAWCLMALSISTLLSECTALVVATQNTHTGTKCLPITYEVISHQRAWVMWQALNQRANEKLKRNSNKNSLRATRAVDVGGWVFQVGKYANLTGFRFYLIQLPKEQNKTWAQYIILILDWLQLIRFLTQLFMHKCIRLFIWIIKF